MTKQYSRPMYPGDTKLYLEELVCYYDGSAVSAGMRGAVRKHMSDIIADDSLRKKVLGWLFFNMPEEFSTSELADAHVYALHKWIGAEQMDFLWIPNKYAIREMQWVASYVQKMKGDSDEGWSLAGEAARLGGVVTKLN